MRLRQSANAGRKLPNVAGQALNLGIPVIRRSCWNQLQPYRSVPEGCSCGQRGLVELTPYHTHQGLELPVVRPEVTHWLLHQGRCLSCGHVQSHVPADHASGYGPRLTGFVGEMAGIVGASRSAVQALCASVFGIPLSKGAIQKMVDRVSKAIVPYYNAIGQVARDFLVNYIDETSWLMHGDRHWLWVMANP